MQRITWYALLAVVALVAPSAGRAQAPQPQAPQAKVRELATIEGDVSGFVRLPSGRALIYTSRATDGLPSSPRDSTFTYDIATKRRTLLGTNMLPAAVSPRGDRLAFTRSSEDGTGNFVWTMPIDPQTGLATSQAQRVSLRPIGVRTDRASAFSPDSKMLVYNAGPPRPNVDLTLVPATGGPERVVASGKGGRVAWSVDGKSLYWAGGQAGNGAFRRVPVAGGRSELLFPLTKFEGGNVVGLSPDARVAFFLENPDRFSYRTTSGVDGEISVALPPLDNGWAIDFTLDSMLRYTTMTQVMNRGVRILDLTTGKARDLLPGNVQSSAPAWSPDGRRLAVLSGNLSHYDITVVNADGSSPRRYPVPMHLDGWGRSPWGMPWSPDGRFLAFRANRATDGQKVGFNSDDQRQLALLDVNSGQTRVLTTSSRYIDSFVWRSDGNGIRTLETVRRIAYTAPSRWSILEIPLNGPERLLRDISAEFPGTTNIIFASDREAIVTATVDRQTVRFIVPLDGGAARRLPDPGIEPGFRAGGPGLAAGNQLFLGLIDAKGEGRGVKIISTVGDPTRTLRVPFNGRNPVFHPDGKQVIAAGKATGDSLWKLFLVPLDGSPTRVIGEIPRGTGGLLAPSPDGKLLAYTADGIYTTKIFEIDFSPALQAIMKR